MNTRAADSSVPQVINAITVDVEDWLQSTIDPALPLTNRFHANTRRVLEAFDAHNVQGTFFVLGRAAERAPELVREIHRAGHEIQSHGYGHELITELTPQRFRADVERSKKMLEDIIGQEIHGYRAPAFTITLETLWALDVLVEVGFSYDSSVFPVRMKRYGVDNAPCYPHLLTTPSGREIKEFPVASCRVGGRRVPTGGGGYFRLFPYFVLRRGVRQLNHAGHSATIYMHPYEYAPSELSQLDHPISWRMRLHQGLGRKRFPSKVDRLLSEFRFGCIQDVIASQARWPTHEHCATYG
jgi:polysaccharide deacetylase family protein (PEP-CTERM system associated)